MSVIEQKPVGLVVLDTSPMLNNTPSISTLLAKCEKLFTVPSVINEVKDRNARSRLEITTLPFLTIRAPKLENIKFVSEFSRRTGDFAVLSKPDIQVLALAYELDCERNGGDWRLRKSPGQKIVGDALPQNNSQGAAMSQSHLNEKTPSETETGPEFNKTPPDCGEETREQCKEPTTVTDTSEILQDLETLRITDSKATADKQHQDLNRSGPGGKEFESASSDSDGWITPSNIKRQQVKDQNASTVPISEDQRMEVTTITGDFAMQNVLLQIGLNLLSPSLQKVKNIRTYILRCHACFEKVKDTNKQFCPRCGKPTLTRVSCSTNQKGEFKIHLKKNMQWNHRGDRFSIPKPVSGTSNGKVGQGKGGGKGGWGQELILAEDQKEYLRATNKTNARKETNLMDEDYLPGILTGDRRRAGGRPKIGVGRNVNSKKRI